MLRADVQKFYPSVYTHSIAWAVETKAKAKTKLKSMALLGNRLDACIRQAQLGQSVGIPIGPDTSWVISEVILAAVDELLAKQLGGIRGNRAVDDYELYFKTAGEAEDALTSLQAALAYYGLDLNSSKQGAAPAIGLDARFSSADVPLGGVNRLLGAGGGRERRQRQRDERAAAREAATVGSHASKLIRVGPNGPKLNASAQQRGRWPW
jgi:hypothetical protein